MALPVLLALALLAGCHSSSELGAQEKALMLRAHDLVEAGYAGQTPAHLEKFNRVQYFDRTVDLEYEFETPDAEMDHPLYLATAASFHRNERDAKTTVAAERVGIVIGLKGSDVVERRADGFYRYGDESTFSVLLIDDEPIGHIFTTRDGTRTYSVVLSGMHFDDAQAWKALIEPKLQALSAHELR